MRWLDEMRRWALSIVTFLVVAALLFQAYDGAASEDRAGSASADVSADFAYPRTDDGWLDLHSLLVASDGSRSLGNHRARLNDSRDRGSKSVFFDPVARDNESADVYWWDGRRMVDSAGRVTPGSHLASPRGRDVSPWQEGKTGIAERCAAASNCRKSFF